MYVRVKSLTSVEWEEHNGHRCQQWHWNIADSGGVVAYSTDKNGKGIIASDTNEKIADESVFDIYGYSKSSVYIKIRRFFGGREND